MSKHDFKLGFALFLPFIISLLLVVYGRMTPLDGFAMMGMMMLIVVPAVLSWATDEAQEQVRQNARALTEDYQRVLDHNSKIYGCLSVKAKKWELVRRIMSRAQLEHFIKVREEFVNGAKVVDAERLMQLENAALLAVNKAGLPTLTKADYAEFGISRR